MKIGICSVLKCDVSTDSEDANVRHLVLEMDATGNYDVCLKALIKEYLDTDEIPYLESYMAMVTKLLKPDLPEEERTKIVDDISVFSAKEMKFLVSLLRPPKGAEKPNTTSIQATIGGVGGHFRSVSSTNFIWTTIRTLFSIISALKKLPNFLRYSSKEYLDDTAKLCDGIETTRERFCISLLRSRARPIVSKWYGLRYLGTHGRTQARYVMSYIGEAFDRQLKRTPWMDEGTKKKARIKLRKMVPRVGYPLQYLNDTIMESLYSKIGTVFRNESLCSIILRFDYNAMYMTLSDIVSREKISRDFSFDYTTRRSRYMVNYNTVVIQAGFLQDFFFNENMPLIVNLATVGRTMAHEITHGFGDTGREYDGSGQHVNWFTDYATSKFDEKKNCFLEQYGSIVDPLTNKSVDGSRTLEENIADNGGMRVAYQAYLRLTEDKPEVTLPGLQNFTQDQLFFLSFATAWCVRQDVRPGDPHTPTRFRVNVPLQNMEEFASAFHCPRGSAMRLSDEDRCIMW
ncbi:hypothetical protein MTO96_034310 [Rhipicephalus appendiculatus]